MAVGNEQHMSRCNKGEGNPDMQFLLFRIRKEKALIFRWGGKMSEVIQDSVPKKQRTKDNVSTEYSLVHFLHYI